MKRAILFAFIFIYLTACSDRNSANEKSIGEFPVIDVVGSIGQFQRLYMSDFFSSIELIPLDIDSHFLIGGAPVVMMADSLIIISSIYQFGSAPAPRNVFVFDRSGRFVNQIGRRGQGPGEYRAMTDFFLNADRTSVFINSMWTILEFGLDGTHIRTFPVPRENNHPPNYVAYLENNLFLGVMGSFEGVVHRYLVFDSEGVVVQSLSSNLFWDTQSPTRNSRLVSMPPFNIDGQVSVKELVNDTIFTFTDVGLQPTFVFNLGRYAYPLGVVNSEGKREILPVPPANTVRYISINQIIGTSNFLFYTTFIPERLPRPQPTRPIPNPHFPGRLTSTDGRVFGIYDIAQNVNILLDTHQQQRGFINDMDGGLSFFPRHYAGNGEVIDIWTPEDMLEILTEEYFAAKTISDPEAHQRLREILRNLVWDDNPVVVIARLKE